MRRMIDAFLNSARAWRHLVRHEAAFRDEMVLLAVAIPAGWLLASNWPAYALLIGSLLVLVLVEVLNTAIEAACNAVSRDFSPDIRLAKDCGSLAVAIAILLAAGVWGLALWERLAGLAV